MPNFFLSKSTTPLDIKIINIAVIGIRYLDSLRKINCTKTKQIIEIKNGKKINFFLFLKFFKNKPKKIKLKKGNKDGYDICTIISFKFDSKIFIKIIGLEIIAETTE